MTYSFEIESIDATLPLLGTQTLELARDRGASSHVTILLGRNGSGKSTLLRDLTQVFRRMGRGKRSASQQFRQIKSLSFVTDREHGTTINTQDLGPKSGLNDSEIAELFPRDRSPRRIIAVSFTPFDKFPAGDDTSRYFEDAVDDPYYVYLGFRSETVGGSPRTRLLNSIDQLAFRHASPGANIRAATTLHSIGYHPRISINFMPGNHDQVLRAGGSPPHIRSFFDSRKPLSYILDFENGGRGSDIDLGYEDLVGLRRSRILRVSSVQLFPLDRDQPVEMLQLSSGELNLLSGFLGLAAYLEDGCLVMIDEPENSLHPEWQVRYVSMLNEVVKSQSGSHYIIATHSPLIVSGSAGNGATVLRLDSQPIRLNQATAEASPDATLVNVFDVITPGNTYIRQLVLEMMNLIETGQQNSSRAAKIYDFLASTYDSFQDDDPIKQLVRNIIVSRKNKE
ncbi:ATP-binding protein [Rhizobium ruizarguesonis]|uniref:ATP-binding protein n=1 Tax=Rhizobium ruizarguesonis TaxID=2081791 RepID=UPI001031F58A|nr:ATP-binding protein [Rhizobium ruizarguesonis]TBA24688.1 ATP-binding protein [Rhizobium ruizarguesonis]